MDSKWKKKIAEFVNSKGGKGLIIGSCLFLVLGLLCFIVGYGVALGWDTLIAWFSSTTATALYICIGVFVLVLLWVITIGKRFEE